MELVIVYPDETTDTVDLRAETPPPQAMEVRTGGARHLVRSVFLSVNTDGTARYNAVLGPALP
jgi:hypothetical protein